MFIVRITTTIYLLKNKELLIYQNIKVYVFVICFILFCIDKMIISQHKYK